MDSEFLCPVCKGKLTREEKSLRCKKNHTFDFARSGYVNLLLSNAMNAKAPGDNKLMVKARREFLEKGYYQILADKLCETVGRYAKAGVKILDAGCGEGYYTSNIFSFLNKAVKKSTVYGIDISKYALEYAAKREKHISFAVASIFHMPVADNSVDLLLSIFAPYCGEEFQRVLIKNGIMILVIPSERHLWELKKEVYEKPYLNEVHDYKLQGFNFVEKLPVNERIQIASGEDILNLFAMTPYFYKTSEQGKERLSRLNSLETEIGFEILVYRKA